MLEQKRRSAAVIQQANQRRNKRQGTVRNIAARLQEQVAFNYKTNAIEMRCAYRTPTNIANIATTIYSWPLKPLPAMPATGAGDSVVLASADVTSAIEVPC